ncbi:13313_t:CDS:2, partial [Racocetra fulgida]
SVSRAMSTENLESLQNSMFTENLEPLQNFQNDSNDNETSTKKPDKQVFSKQIK